MQTIAAVTLDTNRVVTRGWIETRIPDWCDLHVHVIDAPIDKGFSAARNYAFAIAALSGAEWGLMLDTDMHYEPLLDTESPIKEQYSTEVIAMTERSGSYTNDRLFRLPLKGQFVGVTHEYYDIETPHRSYYSQCRFWEDDKSPDQLQAKAKRDIQLLNAELVKDHTNARNLYYRADSYAILGDYHKAIASFNLCSAVSQWQQEAAWSMYRAATMYVAMSEYHTAIYCCTASMSYDPYMPESAWLAGYCSHMLQQYTNGIMWAHISISLGKLYRSGLVKLREGFRELSCWYEKPFDLMYWLSSAVNDKDTASWCAHERDSLAVLRLREWS